MCWLFSSSTSWFCRAFQELRDIPERPGLLPGQGRTKPAVKTRRKARYLCLFLSIPAPSVAKALKSWYFPAAKPFRSALIAGPARLSSSIHASVPPELPPAAHSVPGGVPQPEAPEGFKRGAVRALSPIGNPPLSPPPAMPGRCRFRPVPTSPGMRFY